MSEPDEKKLTAKQLRFCEEYLVDFNATQAANRAGYSGKTAHAIGWENLRKPEIRQYINKRLEELSLSKTETLKAISDIARGTLNPYFKSRQIVRTPKVEISLGEYIERRKVALKNLQAIHKHALKAGLLGEDEALESSINRHNNHVDSIKLELISLEVELESNPLVTRIIDGEPMLEEVVDVDLTKLTGDKEAPRIKSVKYTEFGPTVEICAPDAALVNLARVHGLFEKDNEQSKPVVPVTIHVEVVPPVDDDE